jgi:hypothetical protein
MKKLLVLLFLSQTIYAQKTYKFDYILEYKNKIDSTKLISNPTYYVNSKENSYQVLTTCLNFLLKKVLKDQWFMKQ